VITALGTDQAKTIGIVAIIVLVVAAILVNLIVAKVVSRVIVLVIALVLIGVVWTQRSHIESAAKNCNASFLGIHLTPSDPTLKAHCQQLTN